MLFGTYRSKETFLQARDAGVLATRGEHPSLFSLIVPQFVLEGSDSSAAGNLLPTNSLLPGYAPKRVFFLAKDKDVPNTHGEPPSKLFCLLVSVG